MILLLLKKDHLITMHEYLMKFVKSAFRFAADPVDIANADKTFIYNVQIKQNSAGNSVYLDNL